MRCIRPASLVGVAWPGIEEAGAPRAEAFAAAPDTVYVFPEPVWPYANTVAV